MKIGLRRAEGSWLIHDNSRFKKNSLSGIYELPKLKKNYIKKTHHEKSTFFYNDPNSHDRFG